jgi:hypothetical protein
MDRRDRLLLSARNWTQLWRRGDSAGADAK